jgi:tetratricopeptide (TPR) repeat protein
MHRLVQAVLKDGMDVRTYHQWAERVVQAVNDALPDNMDYGPHARYARYLSHAQECAHLIEQEQLTSFAARRLLHQLGTYLREHARYAEAETFFQHSLRIMEKALGPDHPQVAYPLYGLAALYSEQSKYAEAEPLYQRALRIWEEALGPDHPKVAYPLNGLANLYREQGKYDEAEPLYQRALRIREQALGPNHPLTREVVRNYANLLRKMGRETEASELEARFPSS